MSLPFEVKLQRGERAYILTRSQEQRNVVRVDVVNIVGHLYESLEKVLDPAKPEEKVDGMLYYFFKYKNDDESEDVKYIPAKGVFTSEAEAIEAMTAEVEKMREEYDKEIASLKKRISALKEESVKITRVLPHEKLYQAPPSTEGGEGEEKEVVEAAESAK